MLLSGMLVTREIKVIQQGNATLAEKRQIRLVVCWSVGQWLKEDVVNKLVGWALDKER